MGIELLRNMVVLVQRQRRLVLVHGWLLLRLRGRTLCLHLSSVVLTAKNLGCMGFALLQERVSAVSGEHSIEGSDAIVQACDKRCKLM